MFWKFGFQDTSTIDALLDKEEVSLDAILDEDDLLQECKSQNTRLMDYFQRIDVLQRLFGYVSGNIEGDGLGKVKYPYIATEVLCSELWCIVETCLSNANQLLTPFWDSVLDRDPEDMRTQSVMASHFTKINATFLYKKPSEMLVFIRSQPNVVERLLRHIETPAIVDLLVRVVQLDEVPACAGVLEWLSAERLIPRLVDLLSPSHSESMHATVSELIKGIISMSAPSPGAGITDGLQNGPASNLFARQLARRENVERLVGYMLDDVSVAEPSTDGKVHTNGTSESSISPPPTASLVSESSSADPVPIADLDSAVSSGTHAISIIIELIRKNNSDYFEPYLFHTLRNRLIQVQQHMHVQSAEGREALEQAFNEMIERMAVVHFRPMLEIMCDRMESFQKLLLEPRSSCNPISTTLGPLIPLTFERFRICELYAELLHCSNMSLLNRPPAFDNLYDGEGRLQGGLSALEDLARVIAIGAGTDEQGNVEDEVDEMEPAQELPVSGASVDMSMLDYSDDEDMSGNEGSEDDAMEEIDMSDSQLATPPPVSPPEEDAVDHPPFMLTTSATAISPSSPGELTNQGVVNSRRLSVTRTESDKSSIRSRQASISSRKSLKRSVIDLPGHISIGDKLKQCFSDAKVLPTLLDLFFQFPWNNFLHSVVYDFLHQILTGRVDRGRNRELTISLFRDGLLLHRIVEAQKRNDAESSKPGHVRLGYMGHLTLISEDVIGALEHYPPDLRILLAKHAPQPDWDDYVSGRYHETKVRDTSLLGGGKPVIAPGAQRPVTKWKVDEAEITPSMNTSSDHPTNGFEASPLSSDMPSNTLQGEFRRTARLSREASADFGAAPFEPEGVSTEDSSRPQFATYLAREMSLHTTSDDGSDDEDEDSGWLSNQSLGGFGQPPVSVRNNFTSRRPLDPGPFDDAFTPSTYAGSSTMTSGFADNFSYDEDQFGPFSDAAAAPLEGEHFSFTTVSDEDTSFDNFGDFGDFQSGEGDMTPTGGSWSFASASDASISSTSSEEPEVIEAERGSIESASNSPQHLRTDL